MIVFQDSQCYRYKLFSFRYLTKKDGSLLSNFITYAIEFIHVSPHFWCDIHACVPFFGNYIKWICKIDFKAFTIKSTSVWEFHCWFWLLTLFADLLANVACKILLVNFCLLILVCLFCLLDDNFCIMLAREFCWLDFADWILFAGSCLLDHTFLILLDRGCWWLDFVCCILFAAFYFLVLACRILLAGSCLLDLAC